MIGSIVSTSPSVRGWVSSGTRKLGTSGGSWMRRPMPLTFYCRATVAPLALTVAPAPAPLVGERCLGGADELQGLLARLTDWDRDAGVGVEPIQPLGDVELEQV